MRIDCANTNTHILSALHRVLKQSRLWCGSGVHTERASCWNNGASQAVAIRLHFQCRLSSFSCRGSETPWGHDGRGQLVVWRRKWRAAGAVFSQGETHRAHHSLLFKIKFITFGVHGTAFPAPIQLVCSLELHKPLASWVREIDAVQKETCLANVVASVRFLRRVAENKCIKKT